VKRQIRIIVIILVRLFWDIEPVGLSLSLTTENAGRRRRSDGGRWHHTANAFQASGGRHRESPVSECGTYMPTSSH